MASDKTVTYRIEIRAFMKVTDSTGHDHGELLHDDEKALEHMSLEEVTDAMDFLKEAAHQWSLSNE